ncbi:putative bifunctional diguanylate cyclase/phosphodiesterase [Pengzhenrongella sicca]|uniref:EAL domain-containing protein n=1 Tax=Pengzhenrongella sicca TaxID=2819238 RepID=A0A8A4ZEW4_9MICO|nr:bifunctional diguanylate cyclase/phosphodiesterase [Pengzhenrongella sicca]QTE29845.1 EAL domain-containing protein [Pengzhenrongella sicca]
MGGRGARWWQYLIVGVLLTVGELALPRGLPRYVGYLALGVSAVVAMSIGLRRNRPVNARAWVLIAGGNGAWLVGDAAYNWHTQVPSAAVPPPVWAYVPYLVAYLLLALGLLMLARARDRGRGATAMIDTAVLTMGVGLVSWVYVVVPAWAVEAPVLDRVIAATYPLCDVLLVTTAIRLVTGPGLWNAASRLLVASVAVLLLSNGLLQRVQLDAAFAPLERPLDVGWLLAFVLWAAAALHPSMRALSEPAPAREDAMLVNRLVGLMAAVMTGPAIVTIGLLTDTGLHPWPVVIASAAMAGLILARMIGMVRRLTRQAARLGALAETDFVTGLANRRGFADRLDELFVGATAFAETGTGPERLSDPPPAAAVVILVDIERFADVTDSFGHDVGDALVAAVGSRLLVLFGPDAVVARTGEGTFAVLHRLAPARREPASSLDRDAQALLLKRSLEGTYELAGLSLSVEVCLGGVLVPGDAPTAALALHRADVALVSARSRPGRIARYQAELETGGTFAAQLVGELLGALARGEVVLHYQPQVELRSGRVLGVEALVRWEHPVHGLLVPDAFIPAAEQTGVIGPLTRYLLDLAVEQCARWRAAGLELTVAVNLSARNLLDPALLTDVRAALARHGLPATALELEITEGTVMMDPARSRQVLGALADLGITLSIDDYGTGYSSLAYLQRLPMGRLKIDRTFITDLVRDEASATIVRSTIELARHLRLEVVAEGVEDDATLRMLRDMDCFAAQGFGLGRPVPPAKLPALVLAIEARLGAATAA